MLPLRTLSWLSVTVSGECWFISTYLTLKNKVPPTSWEEEEGGGKRAENQEVFCEKRSQAYRLAIRASPVLVNENFGNKNQSL